MKKNKSSKRKFEAELAEDMESNFIDPDNYLTKVASASNPSFQSSVSSDSSSKSGSKSKKRSNSDYRLGRS